MLERELYNAVQVRKVFTGRKGGARLQGSLPPSLTSSLGTLGKTCHLCASVSPLLKTGRMNLSNLCTERSETCRCNCPPARPLAVQRGAARGSRSRAWGPAGRCQSGSRGSIPGLPPAPARCPAWPQALDAPLPLPGALGTYPPVRAGANHLEQAWMRRSRRPQPRPLPLTQTQGWEQGPLPGPSLGAGARVPRGVWGCGVPLAAAPRGDARGRWARVPAGWPRARPPPGGAAARAGWGRPSCPAPRRSVSLRDDAISRRPVAGAAAMEQELERLRGAAAALQAHIRGYLVRKRFRRLREEYERAVMEIEGGLDLLQWKGGLLPRPMFLQEKQVKAKRSIGQEAVSEDQSATDKEQQKLYPLETSEPEKDCDSRGITNPAGQLQGEEVPSGSGADGARLNPEPEAETPTRLDCSLPGESSEWKNCSNVSSVWSSTILETGSARASQELSFGSMEKELPEMLPELQRYRKHLAMEMLWLQQAIASRKNYLILKQRLGAPER